MDFMVMMAEVYPFPPLQLDSINEVALRQSD